MKKLIFWAIIIMALAVGVNQAALAGGATPEQAALTTTAAALAVFTIIAAATDPGPTIAAALAALAATTATGLALAAAALAATTAAASRKLQVPYWQVLSALVIVVLGVWTGIGLAWWWAGLAVAALLLFGWLFSRRERQAEAFS